MIPVIQWPERRDYWVEQSAVNLRVNQSLAQLSLRSHCQVARGPFSSQGTHLPHQVASETVVQSALATTVTDLHNYPRNRWVDQIWRDNNLPPADLWRRAVNRGHRRVTLWPLPAKR